MFAQVVSAFRAAPARRISVVMVSYHTGASLFEAMNAVLNDPDILELIIVDNGNPPSARHRIFEFAQGKKRVRILQGHGNVGFGRGCNYGARMAKGDYFLFLNPDAIISNGAALKMADAGDALNRPWIAGGFLQTPNGDEQRGSRRDKLTPVSAVVSFTPLHKLPGFKSIHLEKDPKPLSPTLLPIVSGACMMMDREGFNQLNGFDEDYFLHVEDIDVCERARKSGGDVCFVPDAKVMHYGSTSHVKLQKVEREKLRGFIRYFRNYSDKGWAKILLVFSIPFIYVMIMGRAWWLALRAPFVA